MTLGVRQFTTGQYRYFPFQLFSPRSRCNSSPFLFYFFLKGGIRTKNEGKLRPMLLLKLLFENTDEDHALSTQEIVQLMDKTFSIKIHRTRIPHDVELLDQIGYEIGGGDKYDWEYHALCKAMNRRIRESKYLNAPTYPGECIYVPDMLVAIVALNYYAKQNGGRYKETVEMWVDRAKREWIDKETGMLASFLEVDHDRLRIALPIKGSYSALNCYYLSLVDKDFAKEQYELLKKHFKQTLPVTGIKEYHDHSCWLGMDIDAGPIIMNLSPSGTAFAIGCATSLGDMEFRNQLLKTAEIAGSTISWYGQSHYLLANFALVGEAITLAMRTTR